MESSEKRSSRAKSRQSIAHVPSSSLLGVDKQNATIDLSAAQKVLGSISQGSKKKSRGKSLGPGGLEALKETNGNILKIASVFQPKSILKPTVPLTPPKTIPSFEELRQRSTRKKSPGKTNTEALLIDFSTPGPSRDENPSATMTLPPSFDPFSPLKPIDTANNPNPAAGEAAEEERLRQEQKRFVLEQRAARRKSMANRRVSFAPEATLHTWSVMEMIEDSTTSSASNSTRRQSSMTAQQTPQRDASLPKQQSSVSSSLSPNKYVDGAQTELASTQPNGARKTRRRSSVTSEMDAGSDEMYSSSPSGDVIADSSPIHVEDSIASDSDTDGDTAMSMDDPTQNTINSQGSGSSTRSSLEERLRQAASQAGTRGIEYDEFGDDMSMEIAHDTVTNAFQPWARGQQQQNHQHQNQENFGLFSPAKKSEALAVIDDPSGDEATQDMTMEMTRAIGGIVNGSPTQKRRKSLASKRRSSLGRRQSLAADSSYGEESMDLTTVAGGILASQTIDEDEDNKNTDEDITMEFTTAIGGVLNRNRRESLQSSTSDDNGTMDMTAVVGGILAPIEEQTESQVDVEEDKTVAMDITRAVGQILATEQQDRTNQSDDVQSEALNSGSSLQVDEDLVASTPKQMTYAASETGSPSLTLKSRSSGRTRSARASQVSTPRSSTRSTPQKLSVGKQETPPKQFTPIPTRAKTPERTPISTHITHRGASPKRLFQAELQAKASPASASKTAKQQDPLFAQDETTGRQTPRVVLHAPKPHQHLRRRSSGIGIDKEGFGSPSVTQLLARRSSIGDTASKFKLEVSQPPQLRFEDPKSLTDEVDAERADEKRRESGRFLMEQEADGSQEENATLQLKDMIESMTPKKNKISRVKGRKSLAVGSARGLLGKRPLELDDDEEEDSPKRLKAVSREGSPVKKVYLPKPPSKEQTTGRLTRAEQKALDAISVYTPTFGQSPTRTAGTPQQSNRFRNVPQDATDRPVSFEDKLDNVVGAIDPSIEHPPADKVAIDEDKIPLQEFLNMTNIHFIELNTTKRRHTLGQPAKSTADADDQQSGATKECFITAATTLPLLELYQHATRELKSYISTGRKIIRSIEAETLAEQPALFREYVDARPDIKLIMDNQFRNGKTNARLQSREGWYTWRSQLVDGLQTGLQSIRTDVEKDLVIIEEQADVIGAAMPQLEIRRDVFAHELTTLQRRMSEVESIDHRELKASRQDLQTTDAELRDKLVLLKTLQQQMQAKDEALSQAAELKEEMQDQIAEANRVREELRGWAVKDVLALKSRVNLIREQSGWTLTAAEENQDEPNNFGVALTMMYRDILRLFYYPSAYERTTDTTQRRFSSDSEPSSELTAPISLTYAPTSEDQPSELPTEQRFFLQLIQSQLHGYSMMSKGSVAAKLLLNTVSSGWGLACQVSEEIRLLGLAGVTRVSIQSDEKLSVRLILVLSAKSRVDINFSLVVTTSERGDFSLTTIVSASAVYGPITDLLDASKSRKVQAALSKEIEGKVFGNGAWIEAVQGFEEWHCSQVRSQKEAEVCIPKAEVESKEDIHPVGSTTPKSPAPSKSRILTAKRSPLATKRITAVQKKNIPVATSRQDKFRTSQREQQPQLEKPQASAQELARDKENFDSFAFASSFKGPAITPEMQEAMMQQTPIKRVGALRRSPI